MADLHSADELSRREFLKATGVGVATALAGGAVQAEEKALLPQKVLGRTGVKVPVLGLGSASAGHLTENDAVAFYHQCIDCGVNYLDTAPKFAGYGNAQEHLGHVLKERRDEVFVVTKCMEPNGEKALKLLKENLAELQIERADLVYAHNIGDERMAPEKIYAPDGVCKALEKARRDGLTRFLGVSGHNRPGWFLKALNEWEFDVMMNAVSLVARHIYDFEGKVWPAAARQGVGLAAMKVFGGWTAGEKKPQKSRLPDDLKPAGLRYALALPQVSVVVVGMHKIDELKQNLDWVRAFQPLSPEELKALDEPTKALAARWGQVYGAV